MSNQSQEFSFSSFGFISFLVKWWKHIAIATLIGAIASVIISLTMKDRYKSVVIFYPTTTNSISKALLDVTGNSRQDFLEFGEEAEAEQALQILQSDEIREWVIAQYNLYEHYKINPNGKFAKTKMMKKFAKNVNFRRTEFNSVEISVLDEDPNIAAGIANDIAARLDSVKNRIQKERAREGLKIVEAEYLNLQSQIQMMSDSLDKIRSMGINDYASQSEVINKEYAAAVSKGDQRAIKALEEKIAILSKYGGAYVALTDNLELYRKQLSEIKLKYDQARVDAERNIPHKMVVNYAYPADRKTYPKRSMIVLGATFATFCMTIFFLIGLENWKKYKLELNKLKQNQA
ncbi:MAG: Wzz/FepE/Etk N-terminal domain-containing protein [Flavobacteriales bacterium]|nr:Wzz/FepE/Etk N-terminal domain-containing protein [Flavobacteriales bacterium]